MCDIELNNCKCGSSLIFVNEVNSDVTHLIKKYVVKCYCGNKSSLESSEEKAISDWNYKNPLTYEQQIEKFDNMRWGENDDGKTKVYTFKD